MIDPVLTTAPHEGDTKRAGDAARDGALALGDPRAASHEGAASHERTCIGCGEHADPRELVRLVLGPDGEIAVDAAGGGFGRGAHVHARGACLVQAATRGLQRATKGRATCVSVAVKEGGAVATTTAAPLSATALGDAIEGAMARRIAGLLATAVRTRKARIGSDAVTGAWRSGDAALIVVASDAGAAGEVGAVREAIEAGAAVSWGTKETLATLVFRANHGADGVAVVAITDTRIAAAVRDAVGKTMGARDVRRSPQRATQARGGVQVGAPRDGNRSKLSKRAGRASGRRARVKQAVAERGE